MSEHDINPGVTDPNEYQKRRELIKSITPCGQDPLVYWHQLAQDTLRELDKYRKANEAAEDRIERLEHYQSMEGTRIRRELEDRALPNVRELLSRVKKGDFSMNIQFSFYPNVETERKGGYDNDEE